MIKCHRLQNMGCKKALINDVMQVRRDGGGYLSLVEKTDSRSFNYTYLNNFNIKNKVLNLKKKICCMLKENTLHFGMLKKKMYKKSVTY